MRRIFLFNIITVILLLLVTSCHEHDEVNPNNADTINDVKNVLEKAIKEWGVSSKYLKTTMEGYNLVYETDEILQFNTHNGNKCITYGLYDGELCATCIIMPVIDNGIDILSLLEGYSYLGKLNNIDVYENQNENTMASVFRPVKSDSAFYAIGFAPIISNAYQQANHITVTTGDANVNFYSADVSGKVSGLEDDVEVGIIYGMTSDLSEFSGKKVSTKSQGDFLLTINGLVDEAEYYYRAYAIIDDIYYWGEIKSLQTKQFSYMIDGKTYKMIRVKSESIPEFSMMQTELPPMSDFQIADVNIGKLSSNDNIVLKSEFRNFIDKLREETGLQFRLPTTEEWQYAAKGGNINSDYTYSGGNDIDALAWYKDNSGNAVHGIALKKPNELGFYDMSGNYAEMCNNTSDEYHIDGIQCGGSWKSIKSDCKITSQVQDSQSGNIVGTNYKHKNAFEGKYVTVRLVYSRE